MKILVADDDRLLRRIMVDGLGAEGATCSEAATGAEAIQSVLRDRPDICLLDHNFPDMDGLSVLRTLATRPEAAATRVFLLTGSEDAALREQAVALGARGLLRKPVTPSQVFARLREP